jgi:hypothetical protein
MNSRKKCVSCAVSWARNRPQRRENNMNRFTEGNECKKEYRLVIYNDHNLEVVTAKLTREEMEFIAKRISDDR